MRCVVCWGYVFGSLWSGDYIVWDTYHIEEPLTHLAINHSVLPRLVGGALPFALQHYL